MNNAGDVFDNIADETGTMGDYKTGRQGEQFVLYATYKNLTLNGLISDTQTDNARSTFVFPSTKLDLQRQFIDIGYQSALSDRWNFNINGSYHRHTSYIILNAVSLAADDEGENFLLDINTQAKISDKIDFIAGGTHNLMNNDGSPTFTSNTNSLYTQINYQANPRLKLTSGLQYNKPENIPSNLSPRLSAIFQLNNHWQTKLLYSEAFRDASPVERFISIPGILAGDPNLKPETISTLDVQFSYEKQHNSFAVTYFHSKQNDLIVRSGSAPIQIINAGDITYDGIELEGRWKLMPRLQFTGNLSYLTNEDTMEMMT